MDRQTKGLAKSTCHAFFYFFSAAPGLAAFLPDVLYVWVPIPERKGGVFSTGTLCRNIQKPMKL